MTEVIEHLKQRIEELKDSLHRHYSIEVESRLSELERTVTILCSCVPINEDFESEWKRYCDSKGGGAVTMNIKDVAKHFSQWQKEELMKDAIDTRIDKRLADMIGYTGSERVKVIIIKE